MFAVSRKFVEIEGTGNTKILTSREHADLYSKVQFIAEGGNPSSQMSSYVIGQEYGAFPSSTKEGYSISAWCSDSACTQVVDSDSEVDYKIQKMYAGWKKKGSYTRLEYIQGTGTQAIDTTVVPTSNTRMIIDIEADGTTGGSLLGTQITDQANVWRFFNYNGSIYFDLDGRITGSSLAANERATIELGNYYVNKNGTRVLTGTTKSVISGKPSIALLGRNTTSGISVQSGINIKIYSCKIYESSTLTFDLIPVKDLDGVVCMYDTVSETYFYNQGTGSFVAGPEIVEVEYLESTGTQYIDTLYALPSGYSSVTCEMSCYVSSSSTSNRAICGTRNSSDSSITFKGPNFCTTYIEVQSNYVNNTKASTFTPDTWLKLKLEYTSSNCKIYKNDVLTETIASSTSTSAPSDTLNLFRMNGVNGWYYIGKCAYYKMTVDGNVAFDYIPVKVDNVGYMYDKVSHKLFGNSGTGSFTIGPEV